MPSTNNIHTKFLDGYNYIRIKYLSCMEELVTIPVIADSRLPGEKQDTSSSMQYFSRNCS